MVERSPARPEEDAREYRLAYDDAGRCCLYAVPTHENEPPTPDGSRESDRLSGNAVRTILGSARKADALGIGFRVMWTFTLREEGEGGRFERPRDAVARGDLVLSAEIRRVLDAFRHYLLRRDLEHGRVFEEGRKVRNPATGRLRTVERQYVGDRTRFEYAWVAENPPAGSKDEVGTRGPLRGTRNPHVHLISPWVWEPTPRAPGQSWRAWKRQKKREWLDFAAYVEALWGHGWVHMEFLHTPPAAGRYMLKAAGYLGKGQESSRPAEPLAGQRWAVSGGVRPVRTVEPLAVSDREALALYAARVLAEEVPRRFGSLLTINRYAISGYDLAPDDFLALVGHLSAGGWLVDESDIGNAEALAQAEEHVRRLREARDSEAAMRAARERFVRSLRPVAYVDPRTGEVLWSASVYEDDPDLSALVPV